MLTHAFVILTSIIGLAYTQFNPSVVPIGTRDQWCQEQQLSCPLICLQLPGATGNPISNTCDPTSLAYSCVCSNNQSPNASEFTQTIPYFICTETNQLCVNACNGLSSCQSACVQDNPCGAQHPKRVNITSTTTRASTASPTGSSTATIYNGFGPSATGTGSPNGNMGRVSLMLEIGQVYGLVAVVGGLLGGVFILL